MRRPEINAEDEAADEKQASGWKYAVAGSAAGMTSSIVTCPFDVVKARLQSQQANQGNLKSTLSDIFIEEIIFSKILRVDKAPFSFFQEYIVKKGCVVGIEDFPSLWHLICQIGLFILPLIMNPNFFIMVP
jgi:hypothetical protein